jgi:hypothetical protein
MPPIRTFNTAPINANPPATARKNGDEGATPLTTAPQAGDEKNTAPSTTTTTTVSEGTSSSSSSYPAARPGAAAVPAPTGTPVSQAAYPTTPTPTRTYPLLVENAQTPPAPQPGSRPVPYSNSSNSAYASPTTTGRSPGPSSSVPPPPKAGDIVHPAAYYAPRPLNSSAPVEQQLQSHPSPLNQPAYPTPNSTSTPYLSTYQPPAHTPIGKDGLNRTQTPSRYHAGGPLDAGSLNDDNSSDSFFGLQSGGQNVLDTARSWMQTAGTKLAEAEAEVWRRVGNDK